MPVPVVEPDCETLWEGVPVDDTVCVGVTERVVVIEAVCVIEIVPVAVNVIDCDGVAR